MILQFDAAAPCPEEDNHRGIAQNRTKREALPGKRRYDKQEKPFEPKSYGAPAAYFTPLMHYSSSAGIGITKQDRGSFEPKCAFVFSGRWACRRMF